MSKTITIGMSSTYDKYYQTADLFGEPYPELIRFLGTFPGKAKVLDLGCGQGRNAIALARKGFSVTGIDNSQVGIDQMNRVGKAEGLDLIGQVADMYTYENMDAFDIILLDSMFHFTKKGREREVKFIRHIISKMQKGSWLVVCVQDTGKKVDILNQAIDFFEPQKRLVNQKFSYTFEDKESGHKSQTDYRMIAIEK